MEELSTRDLAFLHPTSSMGSFGLHLQQFGYSLYQRNRLGISYGQRLGEGLAMGIQLNYYNLRIGEGYGNTSTYSGNIGLIGQISKQLSVAAMVMNPNRSKLAEFDDERLPTLLKLGVGYRYSQKVHTMVELIKDLDHEVDARFGIDYQVQEGFALRIGVATNPALFAFGLGYRKGGFSFDAGTQYDSRLGFSPQLSLQYSFSGKNGKDE